MFRIVLSFLLAAASPCLFAQRYGFQYYGKEQGLTNLTAGSILQDRTGYLWVGTQNGLFRYDGYQFLRFGMEDGLPSSSVESLHEDRAGTLWIGTTSGLARRVDTGF